MQIIYTELKDTLEYTCDVNVFNVSMIMRVSYNSRSKKRLISLTSLDGSILYLKPTYITYGSRIFPNFNAIIDGLSFYITLDRLTLTGDNYLNWANQFRLCFVEYIPFEKGNGWYLAENALEENALTPDFGEWVIKPDGINVTGDNILYQADKTNSILTYDSFATFSLETALVRSFHNVDMQQYAAFTTAVEQLIGSVDWVLDPANNQIRYTDPNIDCTANSSCPLSQYLFRTTDIGVITVEYKNNYDYATNVCKQQAPAGYSGKATFRTLENFNASGFTCVYDNSPYVRVYWSRVVNPTYDPNAEQEEKTLPLEVVAQQVISNAESGEDEVLQMLSQDYINLVANSIFNSDESKQFVKMEDLIDQFEENKTLRS